MEIGWHLHPDAKGAGYATEAASAVMTDAANNGLHSVVAVTDPLNAPSQRVCQRL
ncbi:GNAT family N-acetyltransferase [Arthrobacter sp. BF1]|uniref:GNAT family N-acetyltransferase n=1 Tax=Arthrobacter sp. BF1 TaxID=2821145 RepID=UPI001C4FACD0